MPNDHPRDEWMTLEDVAAYLKLSRSKIYEMARQGAIPCSKLVGRWRFSRSEIDAWVRQQRPQRGDADEGGAE